MQKTQRKLPDLLRHYSEEVEPMNLLASIENTAVMQHIVYCSYAAYCLL